jgi:hypothetical protein
MSGVIPLLSTLPIRLHDLHRDDFVDDSVLVRVDRTVVLPVALRDKLKSVDIDWYRFFTVESRNITKYPGTVSLCSVFPQTINVLT